MNEKGQGFSIAILAAFLIPILLIVYWVGLTVFNAIWDELRPELVGSPYGLVGIVFFELLIYVICPLIILAMPVIVYNFGFGRSA